MQMKSWRQRTISISIIKFKKSLCFYHFMIAKVNQSFTLKKKNMIFFYFNSLLRNLKGKENKF